MRSIGSWIAVAAGVLGGSAAQLQQAALWSPSAYLSLGTAGLLAAVAVQLGMRVSGAAGPAGPQRRCFKAAFAASAQLALALAVAASLFACTGWRAHHRLAERLASELEGVELVVSGIVVSLPHERAQGSAFLFELSAAEHHGMALQPGQVPPRIWLSWPHSRDADAGPIPSSRTAIQPGQRWRFAVKLRQPHGLVNPYGFDVELWWFEQGIRALGTVRERPVAPRLLDASACCAIDRWRHALRAAIYQQVHHRSSAGVLAGLALGDQSAIERDDWEIFRRTGIAHLMSVSGLHITMFAWLAGGAVNTLWRRSARLSLLWPAPWAARWVGLLAAGCYALFAGWGLPAQRTVCMLAVATGLQVGARRWPWPAIWAASAVVLTLFDPWALLQPGFWLSFTAVGLLLAASSRHNTGAQTEHGSATSWWQHGWRLAQAGIRTQAIATLGLTPLSLVFFQQVSLVGFAANLVAIPLVSFVVMPLSLLGAIAPPLWTLAAWLLDGLRRVLELLATPAWAAWHPPAAATWAQLLGLGAAVLLVLPLPWRLRLLSVPLALPLLWPPIAHPAPGQFELLVADVGQGTAILVRTARHAMVFDAGPAYGEQADAGQRVLTPMLRAFGIRRLNRLVLSHRDSDHVGGAASLMQALSVDELLSSLEVGHPLLSLSPHATRCQAGQSWAWDGVRFEVLHPHRDDYPLSGLAPRQPNALSCVLKVSTPDAAALLTGDIERAQEDVLLARSAPALAADVLMVPHHGSKTSSAASFLHAVAPRWAIVQAGYRNRYGHPAAAVLARYRSQGITVIETTRCGAWRWQTVNYQRAQADTANRSWSCERLTQQRYWRHLSADQ